MNINKLFRAAVAACALFAGLTGTASADYFTYVSDTTGKPTWDMHEFNRPGYAVPYDVFHFSVDQDGFYKIMGAAVNSDSVMIIYEGGFDASNPHQNEFAFSDDLVSLDTSGVRRELKAGVQYSIVFTGFNDDCYGQYIVSIGGAGKITPGPVMAVPEPSTWLMLGAGLALVGAVQRRKAKQA